MAKQVAVTLKTQATELVKAMGLEVLNAKQFQDHALAVQFEGEDNASKWVELSVVAPVTFGEGCFTKGRSRTEDYNPDYLALKETLEHAYCMQRYGIAMPDIVRSKPGAILTAKQQAERDTAAAVRGVVSVMINRMGKYFAEQVGAQPAAKALPTFTQWAGTAYVALAGKPETTKSKNVAPKISGKAPQVLLDLLAVYCLEDNKEHREAFEAWALDVAKLSASMKAASAISAVMNKPRKVVKSDAAKRSTKVAA